MLLYVGLLAPLLGGDPGPSPQLWTFTALVLYPVSCWLAVTVANTEDPVQRQVTIAAAGGPTRVAIGVLLTCLLADAVLVAIAMCWPMLTSSYAFSTQAVMAGVLAHVAVAGTGTAAGLLCARPVLHGIGWSAIVGGGTVFIAVTQNWLPPVGLAVRSPQRESRADQHTGAAGSTRPGPGRSGHGADRRRPQPPLVLIPVKIIRGGSKPGHRRPLGPERASSDNH
jgi:hypothetical protein